MSEILRVGILSDTHGAMHPRVPEVFAGVDHILHAGDVGGAAVLDWLRELAPVTHVEGNVDDGFGEGIVRCELGGVRILLTHVLPRPSMPAQRVADSLREHPADLVVFGHSHLPHHQRVGRVTFFNPASAGPRRFDYPVSVGILEQRGVAWDLRHIALDQRSVAALERRMNQLQ